MSAFFDQHGLRRVINASGTETVHGASRCSPAVVEAVREILPSWVEIADLQRAASETIAAVTGAEAGIVTGCSAAGISICVAAAMTGQDLAKVEQLPDTAGMKNRVVMQKGHEVNFGAPVSQMARIAGAEVVEIGTATSCAVFQLEAALRGEVAAALYVISHHTVQSGMIDLATFCAICRKRGVPVIVDAAAEYDWPAMIAAGATAVIFSAQKAAAGTTAGVIAGEEAFIRACYYQDRGVGRVMKAGKESIAGAMAALAQWQSADRAAIKRGEEDRLAQAEMLLAGIAGLRLERQPDPPGNPFERLMLHVDPAVAGLNAHQLGEALAAGDVKVVLRSLHTDRGYLLFDVRRIDDAELRLIADKIRDILASATDSAGTSPVPSKGDVARRALEAWPARSPQKMQADTA
ncbi:L-seryl-tRNA(Ser) seleniumtransferase [Hyphomicrobiales bacterium]|nr:L-seryl-tRNA(Ser) seleniumtransferase [Hyphomicrobiales bacterium]CAH1675751.1 L-seryl-tRNA(Ser) seleniumtransferase [Hyphomicrobiales bacterium]